MTRPGCYYWKLLEHCILTRGGCKLWVGREVKMEIPDYPGSCTHSEANHSNSLAQPLADNHRFVGRERAALVHRYPRDRLEYGQTPAASLGDSLSYVAADCRCFICGYHSCSSRIWGRLLDPRPLASIVFGHREARIHFARRPRHSFSRALFDRSACFHKSHNPWHCSFICISLDSAHSPAAARATHRLENAGRCVTCDRNRFGPAHYLGSRARGNHRTYG